MQTPKYSALDIAWISLFTIMLTMAVIGNTLVIWIVLAHRRMRTVTNYFLLNLSVADLTMAMLNGAPNFFYMLRNDWIFGEILCVVNNFVANFTVASCVFTMMAISIDRWIAVMRPLQPRMKKRSAWKAIFAIWISSALLASPALLYSKTILYSTHVHSCMLIWPDEKTPDESVYDLSYNVCLLIITYVVPMTSMAICYGSMSWELWGHTHIGEVTERQRNSMISKRKVVRMFIIVVLSFAICWLPYHGYFIYMYWDKSIVFKKWAQPLYLSFYFLAMSTSMINPVVYYFMNSRFRDYIQETMKNFCFCRKRESDLDRGMDPGTPPLLRHCNKYNSRNSQSCSRSRSGDDNRGSNDNHHHHHHKQYPRHPRMNPHQEGLDDRMIPLTYHHPNGIKMDNRASPFHHHHHHFHHHHRHFNNNNNGNGTTELIPGTCGGGATASTSQEIMGTSPPNYRAGMIIGDNCQQRKVSLYAYLTQRGTTTHRLIRNNVNGNTRTTYC